MGPHAISAQLQNRQKRSILINYVGQVSRRRASRIFKFAFAR